MRWFVIVELLGRVFSLIGRLVRGTRDRDGVPPPPNYDPTIDPDDDDDID